MLFYVLSFRLQYVRLENKDRERRMKRKFSCGADGIFHGLQSTSYLMQNAKQDLSMQLSKSLIDVRDIIQTKSCVIEDVFWTKSTAVYERKDILQWLRYLCQLRCTKNVFLFFICSDVQYGPPARNPPHVYGEVQMIILISYMTVDQYVV